MIKNYNRIAKKTGKESLALAEYFTVGGTKLGNVTKAASGFEGMISSPTMFLAGESGAEHVSITPVNRGGGGQTINQYIIVQGSILAERDVERIANKSLKRDLKRVGF